MFATGALAVVVTAACATSTRSDAREVRSADGGRLPHTAADVNFMSGMIAHHAQAVLMAGWAPTHDAGRGVRTSSERIIVGQRDEIVFMQRWLRERHEPVPKADPSHGRKTPGIDHPGLMPGMLAAEQLAHLDRARGPEFDRLFLTFMIQHHRGAISMVEQWFSSQGAVQDDTIFRFAADVQADQIAEIDRMSRMLALPAEGR